MELFSLEPHLIVLLLATAFSAGVVDAIAGGGGLLMLPALLSVGVPPHLALGTNKLVGTFGTYTASRVCIAKAVFQPRWWKAMAFSTLSGALLGTLTAWVINAAWLQKLLPLIIVAAALYVLFVKAQVSENTVVIKQATPIGRGILLGNSLGFYDGFFGPGVGSFWMMAALSFYSVDMRQAACLARFMNFLSNLVSLLTFIALGSVDFALGLGLGAALMLGAYVGVHSALKFGATLIKPVFILVVLATAGRLLWLEWV
jgi:uncharacterized membrane protein YfcA